MDNKEPLFYNEYEQFYKMTEGSKAFKSFCQSAFGEDFSQDGFSDINQINRILDIVPEGADIHVLDIGCGNGKMLGYLQKKTGAYIHGFDYSQNAINTAKSLFAEKAEFRQGLIGEIDYPEGQFDVVTSMDSMYFAPDMKKFVSQIMRWLKKDGVLIVNRQRIDPMPVVIGAAKYPEGIVESLGKEHKVIAIDAMNEAMKLGNPKVFNVIVIGVAAKHMDFTKEQWFEVIEKTVKPKFVDINKQAFIKGFDF